MTDEEFEAAMRAELERALMNPDYPKIRTQEEADALHDDFMARLWRFVLTGKLDAPHEAG